MAALALRSHLTTVALPPPPFSTEVGIDSHHRDSSIPHMSSIELLLHRHGGRSHRSKLLRFRTRRQCGSANRRRRVVNRSGEKNNSNGWFPRFCIIGPQLLPFYNLAPKLQNLQK